MPAYYYDFPKSEGPRGRPADARQEPAGGAVSADRFSRGGYSLRSPELREELSRFVQITDPTSQSATKFQAEFGHDDLVCALMLAGSCLTRLGR